MVKSVKAGDKGWVMGEYTTYTVTVKQVVHNTKRGTLIYVQFESGTVMPVNSASFFPTTEKVTTEIQTRIQKWQKVLKKFNNNYEVKID